MAPRQETHAHTVPGTHRSSVKHMLSSQKRCLFRAESISSLSITVSLYIALSVPPSLHPSFPLSLSPSFPSHPPSFHLPLSAFSNTSLSPSLCPSFPLSLSLSLFPSIRLSHPFSPPHLSFPLCRFQSLFRSLLLNPSLSSIYHLTPTTVTISTP